jgi:hypothetical protein
VKSTCASHRMDEKYFSAHSLRKDTITYMRSQWTYHIKNLGWNIPQFFKFLCCQHTWIRIPTILVFSSTIPKFCLLQFLMVFKQSSQPEEREEYSTRRYHEFDVCIFCLNFDFGIIPSIQVRTTNNQLRRSPSDLASCHYISISF